MSGLRLSPDRLKQLEGMHQNPIDTIEIGGKSPFAAETIRPKQQPAPALGMNNRL